MLPHALTFKRTKLDTYLVFDGLRVLGLVQRKEHWSVRGTKVIWTARRAGRTIAEGRTRKEAAGALTAA